MSLLVNFNNGDFGHTSKFPFIKIKESYVFVIILNHPIKWYNASMRNNFECMLFRISHMTFLHEKYQLHKTV